MDSTLAKYSSEEYERFADKAFIEWLIDDLDTSHLSLILYAVGVEKTARKGASLPIQFLRNKLLHSSVRKKLRDREIFPPFPWVMDIEGEMTTAVLTEEMERLGLAPRERALTLFLQNHYEEAFGIYEKRQMNRKQDKPAAEVSGNPETAASREESMPAKREKKLNQKIANLEQEWDRLNKQVKALQDEIKDKNKQRQQEINKLNQMYGQEKKDKEQLMEEVDFLKRENDGLKKKLEAQEPPFFEPKGQEKKIERKKIAFLGDPKNKKILKSDYYEVEIIEPDGFAQVLAGTGDYDAFYLLSWRFPVQEFEAAANEELKSKTVTAESFQQLKIKLGELSSVK